MPDIIDIPRSCPPGLATELRASFAAYWTDPEGSANHLRIAIEHLMDYLEVPREKTKEGCKAVPLKLHQRIEEFGKDTLVGDQLMALKWLGNAGSHPGKVFDHDLLSAFEIAENILPEVVGQRSPRIANLASELNARYNPRNRDDSLDTPF